MKGVFFKILIVLGLTASIDYFLSQYLDSLYKKNYGLYGNGHLNYYLDNISSDTLFIGSSRTLHHIDTRLFSNRTYNLSSASMHIGYQAALIDLLEQKNKLPKLSLIIQLEASEIDDYTGEELRKQIQYLNYYYHQNEYIKTEINKTSTFEFIKHWSSLYSYSGYSSLLITNPIQKINETPKPKGYHPLSGDNFNQEIDSNRNTTLNENHLFYEYLNHIKEVCDRNNIQLICFTSPYFYNDINEAKQNSLLGQHLRKRKINYFNYASLRDRLPKLYTDSGYWYDNIHLNEKGAELFTLILKDDLKSKIK